jgi:hypothetical protein
VSLRAVIKMTFGHGVLCYGSFVSYASSFGNRKLCKSFQVYPCKVTHNLRKEMITSLKDSAFPSVSINVQILRPVYTKGVSLSPCWLEQSVSEKRFGQHKSGAFSTLGSHFLKS